MHGQNTNFGKKTRKSKHRQRKKSKTKKKCCLLYGAHHEGNEPKFVRLKFFFSAAVWFLCLFLDIISALVFVKWILLLSSFAYVESSLLLDEVVISTFLTLVNFLFKEQNKNFGVPKNSGLRIGIFQEKTNAHNLCYVWDHCLTNCHESLSPFDIFIYFKKGLCHFSDYSSKKSRKKLLRLVIGFLTEFCSVKLRYAFTFPN